MAASCLVVGYGSIGHRHSRLLHALGRATAVVSAREIDFSPHYGGVTEALERERPDYVVVANDTARHYQTTAELAEAGYDGRVLIEKPLFDQRHAFPANRFRAVRVGYNLRCHRGLLAFRRRLGEERVVSVQAHVGQFLGDWRPGRDYRGTSSASRARGGGVLRDLSHELDLLIWLFGPWRRLAALGGGNGGLDIDCDAIWTLLLELRDCPAATLHLNCLARPPRREIAVVTEAHSMTFDLLTGCLAVDGKTERFPQGRDDTYLAQHRAMMEDRDAGLCSLAEAEDVVATIDAVETAARERRWVTP